MKLLKISAIAAAACLVATSVSADEVKSKRSLKGNMMEVYNVLPGSANSISEAFADGVFYGRLRTNAFKWDWKSEDTWNPETGKGNKDNTALGLGGSMIYKTASFQGLSATAGMYFSSSPFFHEDQDDIGYTKVCKDTFSRYNVAT